MAISVFPAPSAAGKSEQTVIITSTQSWTVPTGVTSAEFLVVGGGGGGGYFAGRCGGGGGGGGVVHSIFTVTPGASYTITIGAGGAAGSASLGANGSNTTVGTIGITARGGGGGGAYDTSWTQYANGKSGGCGGGGSQNGATNQRGGGGGGAGETGNFVSLANDAASGVVYYKGIRSGAGLQGGDGRIPTNYESTTYTGNPFTSAINGGAAYMGRFGGGGGGSSTYPADSVNESGRPATGIGWGGGYPMSGGNGSYYDNGLGAGQAATAGIANSGGGGGGGGVDAIATNRLAAAGGSGVVIIKYWA